VERKRVVPFLFTHLNLIETLWRKIKYEWLRPQDYLSAKNIKQALFNIITHYNDEYWLQLPIRAKSKIVAIIN